MSTHHRLPSIRYDGGGGGGSEEAGGGGGTSSSSSSGVPPPATLSVLDRRRSRPSREKDDDDDEASYVDLIDVESTWNYLRSTSTSSADADASPRRGGVGGAVGGGSRFAGVVACLGLSVDLRRTNSSSSSSFDDALGGDGDRDRESEPDAFLDIAIGKIDFLRTSRPDDGGLSKMLDGMVVAVREASAASSASETSGVADGSIDDVRVKISSACTEFAEAALDDYRRDEETIESIGSIGADAVRSSLAVSAAAAGEVRIMVALDDGVDDGDERGSTASLMEIVRRLNDERNELAEGVVVVDDDASRSNLDAAFEAFEGDDDAKPKCTWIRRSAAASYMRTEGVDACVVHARSVSADGDVINDVGTYGLAIASKIHGVPFFAVCPFANLDASSPAGDDVEEEGVAPRSNDGAAFWNPSTDVTPAEFVSGGVITERGRLKPSADGTFDVPSFVKDHSSSPSRSPEIAQPEPVRKQISAEGREDTYTEHTTETLPRYLARHAPSAMEALGATSSIDLDCVEIGGNRGGGGGDLNLVFVVTNTYNDRKIIVKQALPYVRCVGESWPLTLDRVVYEYEALVVEKEACPEFVPDIHFFSKSNGLIAMEYVPPPNDSLRKGLVEGIVYPTMASDMGVFCAKTLFKTSGFKLSTTELRKRVEFWSQNSKMCALTEQVVFTEPYIAAANNRWTSPQLDADKKAIETDTRLKLAASRLKSKFVTQTEALLHADLHSGSVLCSPEPGRTYVIDPKFGFYGPMGFDTGAFVANLLLSYASRGGRRSNEENDGYDDWILNQIEIFWNSVTSTFLKLWDDPSEHTGVSYQRRLFPNDVELSMAQEEFLTSFLRDTSGFAGMKMLRRIVGNSHVEDLEGIEDDDVRARCERHGLEIAKELIKGSDRLTTIEDVVRIAREKKPTLAS